MPPPFFDRVICRGVLILTAFLYIPVTLGFFMRIWGNPLVWGEQRFGMYEATYPLATAFLVVAAGLWLALKGRGRFGALALAAAAAFLCWVAVDTSRGFACGNAFYACGGNLKNLATALEVYAEDHNKTYPASLSLLTPTIMRVIPTCPLRRGAPYRYEVIEGGKDYRVVCTGNHGTFEYTAAQGLTMKPDYQAFSSARATPFFCALVGIMCVELPLALLLVGLFGREPLVLPFALITVNLHAVARKLPYLFLYSVAGPTLPAWLYWLALAAILLTPAAAAFSMWRVGSARCCKLLAAIILAPVAAVLNVCAIVARRHRD